MKDNDTMKRYLGWGAAALALGLASLSCATSKGKSPSEPAGPQSGSGTHQEASRLDDVLTILPPGARGSYTKTEFKQHLVSLGAWSPAHSIDQRKMYMGLGTQVALQGPESLTEASLTEFYKQAPLDPAPSQVVSTETPRPGVTLKRDTFGVAHVYGETDADVAYGAGYAGTQDRMFAQDVARHLGAARLSELFGTSATQAVDAAVLRQIDYTEEEAELQVKNLALRYGEEGQALVERIDQFIAGINAAQAKLCPDLKADTCPEEYSSLKHLPRPWTRADVVYATSLLSGLLGVGGGKEYENGVWLRRLLAARDDANEIFRLLQVRDDPSSPVTVSQPFTYEDTGPVDPDAVALPDPDAPAFDVTGVPLKKDGTPDYSAATPRLPKEIHGPFGHVVKLPQNPHRMSNALLVDAAHSANGRPLAVYGCQTAYFSPEALLEVSLHGPRYASRGVAFVGTGLVVQIGRGLDYSWSATSAVGDVIDTVAERLCNLDGSPATLESTGYLKEGQCVAMQRRTHTVKRQDGTPLFSLLDLRTHHGIVQKLTLVGGRPVAMVQQRSTYGRDLDSLIGFARANDPGFVRDAKTFQQAFSAVDYSFNWFYVDDRDIAYFNSGLLPLRARGVDPRLPRWGDSRWDWQKDFLPAERHPQAINPPEGFLVSWNNKPATGWPASDDNQGWGPVQRVLLLRDRLVAAMSKGKIARAQLVGIMEDAATVDARAAYLLEDALAVIGEVPDHHEELQLLRAWLADGAHRRETRSGGYGHQGAIALWDAWYPQLATRVLSGTLGEKLTGQIPTALDNPPYFTNPPLSPGLVGSAWDNVGFYGYVSRDLAAMRGRSSGEKGRMFCGNGSPQECKRQLLVTFGRAAESVRFLQRGRPPGEWTYEGRADNIVFIPLGFFLVPDMPWQNRPTWQQVVNFSWHRPALK
jgi:acyl-homoserine lactone acylase PvdQ